MPRRKQETKPTPVAAVAANVEVRPAVLNMSGFKDETELAAVIPDSTAIAAADESKPRRKRRTKAEMEAAKGEQSSLAADDPRYRDAVNRMSAFGGAATIRTAFAATGKPLDKQEETEVDDYFYVISRKYSLDASQSGIFLSIYAVLLMLRLVATRMMGSTSANLFQQFEGLFKRNETEEIPEEQSRTQTA